MSTAGGAADTTTAGVDQVMKFRVAREVLADAVAWTARSLPPRPSVPVLAGILLEVDGSQLSVSGFDYEVSARAEVDVQASESGRVLVPGRLLAEITRALPPQAGVEATGAPVGAPVPQCAVRAVRGRWWSARSRCRRRRRRRPPSGAWRSRPRRR